RRAGRRTSTPRTRRSTRDAWWRSTSRVPDSARRSCRADRGADLGRTARRHGRGGLPRLRAAAPERDAAASGESVVVTTGTASGKSLAFSLPALDAIARDRTARALFLYPTKALAQDQARWLAGLGLPGLRPAIYDGDTPVEQRAHVRRTANAILTNPDMLHVGVLPHHDRW